MFAWVALALVLSAAFSVLAPRIARTMPPRVATWMLSLGGLLAAAMFTAMLALLSFTALGTDRLVASRAHWSGNIVNRHLPLSIPIGLTAAAALAVAVVRVSRALMRRVSALRAAYGLAGALPDTGAELAVVDLAERMAFAVPGRPGRVFASTGMLRALDPAQRRAVLAHEHAHLAHRHHWHQSAALLAAAAAPPLRALPAAVELACERWADEDAAQASSREIVAHALARAASGLRVPAGVLAVGGGNITVRVAALLAPARPAQRWRLLLLGGLLLAGLTACAFALRDTERLFELAQHAYLAGRR